MITNVLLNLVLSGHIIGWELDDLHVSITSEGGVVMIPTSNTLCIEVLFAVDALILGALA